MDGAGVKPGLGTNIVQALAKQLHANITVAGANPGTTVSISHAHIAAVQDAAAISSADRAV